MRVRSDFQSLVAREPAGVGLVAPIELTKGHKGRYCIQVCSEDPRARTAEHQCDVESALR
jgi:hypothetical protein